MPAESLEKAVNRCEELHLPPAGGNKQTHAVGEKSELKAVPYAKFRQITP